MAENKEPRDEKLIEELYERLWWYTYEASEEEFDEKEVDAITRLLDVLEPVHDDQAFEPGADAALKRFWERYGEEEENASVSSEADASASGESAAEEDDAEHRELHAAETAKTVKTSAKPGRGSKWRKRLIRIAIGAAACVVLLVSVNVGSYALRKKSFFEIVREEVGRTEITVTGNTEGIEEKHDNSIDCSSWEEAEKIVGEDILEPSYIPDGYELSSLIVQDTSLRKTIKGWYYDENGNFFRIQIKVYQEEFKKDTVQYGENWNLIEEDLENDIQFYSCEEGYVAFFSRGKCVYYILNNENMEVLKSIVGGIIE